MLIHFLKWLRGCLTVQIRGYSPERFINLCSNKNILIWNLQQTEYGYEFNMTVQGYRRIKQIAHKTKTIPYIVKRSGFPFLLYRYRKKKVFFFGILLFFILLHTLSLYIWNISISGEYTHTAETILKYLGSQKIYAGVRKKNVDCQELEKKIRAKYTDIGWVSAEIRGTRLLLKLTETNMPKKVKERTKPCHLVAAKDGIITKIVTRKGTPLVKAGDVVKKGDILISGIVSITGDGDEIVKKEPVPAEGSVRMKTFYEYKDSFPLTYTKKIFQEKTKKSFAISLLQKKIFLYKCRKPNNKYDIIESDYPFRLGENFYLPAIWHKIEYKTYEEKPAKYSKNQAAEIEKEHLDRYIKNLTEKGVFIAENNVKILIDDRSCIASGRIIVDESAVKYKSVDDSEWRNLETNEHNGENN